MTEPFPIVVIVVTAIGLAFSFTRLGWPFHAMDSLGRTGAWFHHETEETLDDRADGNRDANIPRRPLRSRES